MPNKLLEALGALGYIVDTPRRATWNALLGKQYGEEITGDPYSGFALEMLGDPVNWATLGLHKYLGAVARKLGPRYPLRGTAADALAAMMPKGRLRDQASFIAKSPDFATAMREVPPEAKYLAEGGEALVLDAGDGTVVRMKRGPGEYGEGPMVADAPRPNIPEVLQPTRSAAYGDTRVERLPMVESAEMMDMPYGSSRLQEYLDAKSRLLQSLEGKGMGYNDPTPGNFGRDSSGNWTIIDPGGLSGSTANAGPTLGIPPRVPVAPGAESLSNLLGYLDYARQSAAGQSPRIPNRLIASILGYNAARSAR